MWLYHPSLALPLAYTLHSLIDGEVPVPDLVIDSYPKRLQLIFSVFKTLTDQTVTVELKNDLSITGVLKSVDQSVSQDLLVLG